MLLADGTVAFTRQNWEYVVWQTPQGDFYIICDLNTREFLDGHCEGEHNILQGFQLLTLSDTVGQIEASPSPTTATKEGNHATE